ncbi:MAG TPA: glutathione peroxidase [Rhodocyclaceae bacterium]|nr:glutathione peroxidase [Rhodocyclaceae bacterium]
MVLGNTLYDFSARRLAGDDESLSIYRDKLVMVVNVASRCGYTPQYAGLEKLWQDFGPRGLTILGFPCNQFGAQEPGDEAEIAAFCSSVYGVTFPLFAKIEVNGSATHPLYAWLKNACPGILGSEAIKWNFTKFIVGRDGLPRARHAPATKPEDLVAEIEGWL